MNRVHTTWPMRGPCTAVQQGSAPSQNVKKNYCNHCCPKYMRLLFTCLTLYYSIILDAAAICARRRSSTAFIYSCWLIRDSANAFPHYQKLCARATPIWGSRRSQPIRSAMHRPRPGGTAFVITVSPAPGKYEILQNYSPQIHQICWHSAFRT